VDAHDFADSAQALRDLDLPLAGWRLQIW